MGRASKMRIVRRRVQKALTLMELLMVLIIVGILAAIAIPVYLDFSIRTKVAELVLTAGSYRTAIAEKAEQAGGVLTEAAAGLTVTPSGRVTGGSVTPDGVVTISGSAATLGTAVTVILTPSIGANGKVLWTCSAEPRVWKYVPSSCRN